MKNAEKTAGKTKLIALAVVAMGCVLATGYAPKMSAKGTVFVDASYKGQMDGSFNKPFNTIQAGIDCAERQNKNVSVRKGVYTENISVWEDVEVTGDGKDVVTIVASRTDRPTVRLYDDAEIRKVTIKNGERGVQVEPGAESTIERCRIESNKKDGIKIKTAKVDDKHKVNILDNIIQNNGWAGIYAERRMLVIKDNQILGNKWDGVELSDGTKGSINGNQVRFNSEDGLHLTLDSSDIWADHNTYYGNGENGVQVVTNGGQGRIGLEDSKFYKNDEYGIARIETRTFNDKFWDTNLIEKDNIFWDNEKDEISDIKNR